MNDSPISPAAPDDPDKTDQFVPPGTTRPIMNSPIIMGLVELPSSQTQTTVGSAGTATALPSKPTGYLQIIVNGNLVVIPYYASS